MQRNHGINLYDFLHLTSTGYNNKLRQKQFFPVRMRIVFLSRYKYLIFSHSPHP